MTPYEYFKEISAIPRGSGNEAEIAKYIKKEAEKHGLFCLLDGLNNVYVRKSASKGRESVPSVLFAAHTDMVCEQLPDRTHDFEKDPLTLIEKDGYVSADGTTLGADDGAGVALMLSIMTDPDLDAPQTEYLFTSSEETGMDGAFGFDYSRICSETVINLDSEDECCACIGCASGQKLELKLPLDRTRKCGKAVNIAVKGLSGGHSGIEIDSGKQSALKLLGSILCRMYDTFPFHIVDLVCNGKDNVIPSSAEATVIFYTSGNEKTAKTELEQMRKAISSTLCKADAKRFNLTFTKLNGSQNENISEMLTLKSTSSLLKLLSLSPQGVLQNIPNTSLPMSSINSGVAGTDDDGFYIDYHSRSSSKYGSELTKQNLNWLAKTFGASLKEINSYPGWEYKIGSRLQNIYADACRTVFGKEPSFTAVHAGLECGIFYEKLAENGLAPDIISIGPALYDIHTPKERMEIDSLERLHKTVIMMLKQMK